MRTGLAKQFKQVVDAQRRRAEDDEEARQARREAEEVRSGERRTRSSRPKV
jgi:hypothetical protein